MSAFHPMRSIVQFAIVAAGVLVCKSSWCWGAEGHRIVGYVADAELTPNARLAVHRLTGTASLAAVANRMDQARRSREGRAMQRWHFVAMPLCGEALPACHDGNCVNSRIEWARDVLSAGKPDEALNAMEVLVHLVGDIHQPLHAADNGDRGGNRVTVSNRMCAKFGASRRSQCSLHAYWDTNLVKAAAKGLSEREAASRWAEDLGPLPESDPIRISDWAIEANGLARTTAYGFEGFACAAENTSLTVTEAYDASAITVVQRQLAKAGKRLARILNSVFD